MTRSQDLYATSALCQVAAWASIRLGHWPRVWAFIIQGLVLIVVGWALS